jgi:CRP-like cAMP-binding protein
LSAVDSAAQAKAAACSQPVELRRGETLHSVGQAVEWVYFPLSGLVGIHSETLAGESVQTGMVGCDGAVGLAEALGSGQYLSRGVVQIPGFAMRMGAANFRLLVETSRSFRSAAERHLEMVLIETRQFVACNALHPVEGRLSRSILDALDRSCLNQILPVTQETLAQMLGAQRTTVAASLSKLQRAGLIRNGRRAIEVLDPARLERLACSCRKTLQFAREEARIERGPHLVYSEGRRFDRSSHAGGGSQGGPLARQ